MSMFYTPGMNGFNVVVVKAEPDHHVMLLERRRPEGAEFEATPIYWGNDELGTLTDAETEVAASLLPASIRRRADPVPSTPAPRPIAMFLTCLVLGAAGALGGQWMLGLV